MINNINRQQAVDDFDAEENCPQVVDDSKAIII